MGGDGRLCLILRREARPTCIPKITTVVDFGCDGLEMKKLSLINLESYREVIIEMMRYGGAVDQIADKLKCSEQDLV